MTRKFTLNWIDWLMILILAGSLALLMTSCATAEIRDKDGNIIKSISGRGMFRDIDHSITTFTDGTVTETLSTKSTTSDIMKAGNEIIGTASGIAAKVMP